MFSGIMCWPFLLRVNGKVQLQIGFIEENMFSAMLTRPCVVFFNVQFTL